jgi:hypothetical protein
VLLLPPAWQHSSCRTFTILLIACHILNWVGAFSVPMIRRAVTLHNTQNICCRPPSWSQDRFLFYFYGMRLLMLKFKRLVIRFIGTGCCVCCPKNDWRGTHVSERLLKLNWSQHFRGSHRIRRSAPCSSFSNYLKLFAVLLLLLFKLQMGFYPVAVVLQ